MRGLVVLLLLFVACGHPHYSLTVPPPTAHPMERLAAFHQLRPTGMGAVTTCSSRGGCNTKSYLVLADGREIWHPEDLEPVVAPQSRAGVAVRRIRQLYRRGKAWGVVLGVVSAVGIGLGAAAISRESEPLFYASLGTLGAGFAVAGTAILITNFQLSNATAELFDQYDVGLAAQLNICARGLAVVPCDAPDMPVAQDPVLRSLPQR